MAFFKINSYKKKDDSALISIFKESGDKNIVGILFERYHHLVLGTCLKYLKNMTLAEDTTMKVFESLFEKIAKHEISYFKGWLHTLTRNECLMILRKKKYDHTAIPEELLEDKEEEIEVKYTIASLNNALAQLKPDQKSCIELFYIQGYCYEEISQELDMDFKKVKSHIQNGKRNLKILLSNGK